MACTPALRNNNGAMLSVSGSQSTPGCSEHSYTIPPEINSAGSVVATQGPHRLSTCRERLGCAARKFADRSWEVLEDMEEEHRQTGLKGGPQDASSSCYCSEWPPRALNTLHLVLNHSASSPQFGGKGNPPVVEKPSNYHEPNGCPSSGRSRIVRSMVLSGSFEKMGVCAWNLTGV